MSDYGGGDYEYDSEDDFDPDWWYVEDSYDAADELAEYTCPSPAYFGEEAVQGDEYGVGYDMYEYFADLEYLSDGGYNDGKVKVADTKRKAQNSTRLSKKRKRVETSTYPPVVWISSQERESLNTPAVTTISGKVVGLLKDWKRDFAMDKGLVSFPEGDFHIKESHDDGSDISEASDDHTDLVSGLDDKAVMAALVDGGHMEALKKMMESHGLDPAAIEQVIQDMVDGKEPEFDDEEEQEGDEVGEEEAGDLEEEDRELSFTTHRPIPQSHGIRGGSARGGGIGTPPVTLPKHGPQAHRVKRKEREAEADDEAHLDDAVLGASAKRRRTAASAQDTHITTSSPPTSSPVDKSAREGFGLRSRVRR